MSKQIWLSSPHMSGNEMQYIKKAMDTNWVAPIGPNLDAFERAISNYCKVDNVLALSSGTAAIHLSLLLLGVEKGDEVIASSFTFIGTVNPIVYQGAIPVLVDSESKTWNMCPDLLEDAIKKGIKRGKKPKAIIIAHLYGMPANMERIAEVAGQYGIPIIEDAAEALGSRYKQRPLGSFGLLSILSFNGNKIITTSGGGALLSSKNELIERARFLATQARDQAPHYQHSQIGYNYRMSNVVAGIGCGQMEVIDQRVRERRFNNKFYKERLKKYKGIDFLTEPGEEYYSNHWLTAVVIDESVAGVSKDDVRIALQEENIESRPLWKPMHLQPVFNNCPVFENGTSANLFNNGLCLPSGSNLSSEDRARIIDVLERCLTNSRLVK